MPAIYFKSRTDAGLQAAQALLAQSRPEKSAVISLSTDASLVAIELAKALRCPMHLYLASTITLPGKLNIGSMNQDGGFQYSGDMSRSFQEYYYQEFSGYLEEAKRDLFSQLNRELKGKEVIRKDLLRGRTIFVVVDCLENIVPFDSLLAYLKTIIIEKLIFCAPISMATDMSYIQQKSDQHYTPGTLDFFFGADHYFEDNRVVPRENVIASVSDSLKLWPS
jgi:predicted phosphoribosyltransferase